MFIKQSMCQVNLTVMSHNASSGKDCPVTVLA